MTGEPLIRIEALHHHYEEGVPALDGIDLEIADNAFLAIIGQNGSGKTTLAKHLNGLLKPTAGRVVVDGTDTATTPVARLALTVGYLFQNPDHQLLAATVWEEATLLGRNLGIEKEVAAPAEEGLRAMGLWERRDAHPFGLSYGQKRRLNVVSVTAHRPRVILADEPLIGQDPARADALLTALRQAADGGACVLAALHDPEAVRRHADRALFLEGGRIVVDAPPEEAFVALARAGRSAYLPVTA